MADVSKIVAALQQSLERLGKAQNAAGQAAARAQQVQQQAARSGFRGIAAGMGAVIERLKRIQEMEYGAVASTKATAETVQTVTADTNPDDVVSTLSPATQQLDSIVTSTGAISTEVDAAKSEVAAALKGGKPGPMIAVLDQIKQAQIQAASALTDAKERTEEVVAQARQTGDF